MRVNDRGPFHGDRIIDLSYAAALKLGYADRGTARVQLDAIVVNQEGRAVMYSNNRPASPELGVRDQVGGRRYLQVGAFSEMHSAQRVSDQLRQLTRHPVFIRSVNSSSGNVLHRVRVGPFRDNREIRELSQRVVAANLGSPYTVAE